MRRHDSSRLLCAMTTNNVPSDAEIVALAKKHIATSFDRLKGISANQIPYEETEQFRRIKAYTVELLECYGQPAMPADAAVLDGVIELAKVAHGHWDADRVQPRVLGSIQTTPAVPFEHPVLGPAR